MLGCDRVVTVLMALSSLVFYVLSNRVQLVSRSSYQNHLLHILTPPAETRDTLSHLRLDYCFIPYLSRACYRPRHKLEARHT